jgi:hypothetical protein
VLKFVASDVDATGIGVLEYCFYIFLGGGDRQLRYELKVPCCFLLISSLAKKYMRTLNYQHA